MRDHVTSSRINGKLPITQWIPIARIEFKTLYGFGTPRFSVVYYKESVGGKDFLLRSVYRNCMGIYSDTKLIKVHIPQKKKIISTRKSYFKAHTDTILPGVEFY